MKTNPLTIFIVVAAFLLFSYILHMDFFLACFALFLALFSLRLTVFRYEVFTKLSEKDRGKIHLNLIVYDFSSAAGWLLSSVGIFLNLLPHTEVLILPVKAGIGLCLLLAGVSATLPVLLHRKLDILLEVENEKKSSK